MEHKQKRTLRTRKVFGKALEWMVADGFVDFSPSEVQQFIKKKEQEGEIGWTSVETMDEVEAMWCSLFLRSKREEENPSLRQLQFLYETYEVSHGQARRGVIWLDFGFDCRDVSVE
jgi:hypothetical protein